MEVAYQDWMPAAAALVFGVVIGWLIRGGRRNDATPSDGTSASAVDASVEAPSPEPAVRTDMSGAPIETAAAVTAVAAVAPVAPAADMAPDPQKLDGIERELREARALLDENEEELRLFGEELNELDAAIKRASGRLRLLFREIRQRALGGEAAEGDE